MKKIILLACICFSSKLYAQKPIETLIDAERNFAQLAADKGAKEAFLTNSTPQSIVFEKNQPVNAQKLWQSRPNSPIQLIWQPAYAGIAASGEIGFTTGPYIVEAKGKEVAWGQFSSLWEKNNNGHWKFMIDIGISHDSISYPKQMLSVETNLPTIKSSFIPDFWATEQTFQEEVKKNPLLAYEKYTDRSGILLRNGNLPILLKQGKDNLPKAAKTYQFTQSISKVSQSKDFAYVSGKTESMNDGKKTEGSYLRVWVLKGKEWRIALETIID
jgi:ketosteroid isomerase-like protein